MSDCYLCGCKDSKVRSGRVRDSADISVLECSDCGLVYLSSLEHIDDNHYKNSGMHDGINPDVDAWLKEVARDDERRYLFLKDKIVNKSVLDFGCGAGGFLERAKTIANRVVGVELEAALQASFDDRKLLVYPNLQAAIDGERKYDLITAFHVVEHLADPVSVLQSLSQLLESKGEIIVEVPSSDDALLTLYNNKAFQRFTYWSQHLFLFNSNTLRMMIDRAGLELNWIKYVQRYPLANHIYWLAKGKPGGHKVWSFMNDECLNNQYEQQLAALGITDTLVASISR